MAKLNIEIELSKILIENVHNLTSALQKIIALHGTEEQPRHECTKMANIARNALNASKGSFENERI